MIPAGIQLVTRINAPLRFDRDPGGRPDAPAAPTRPAPRSTRPATTRSRTPYRRLRHRPRPAPVRVFETADDDGRGRALQRAADPHLGQRAAAACRDGATSAHVYASATVAGKRKAIRPPLKAGDLLLLEEVRGPGDRVPRPMPTLTHRQVVEIVRVLARPEHDRRRTRRGPAPRPAVSRRARRRRRAQPATAAVPIARHAAASSRSPGAPADALTFPLCLSTVLDETTSVGQISVARGNIAARRPRPHGSSRRRRVRPTVRRRPCRGSGSTRGPLTMACDPPSSRLRAGRRAAARLRSVGRPPRARVEAAASSRAWTVVRDLLVERRHRQRRRRRRRRRPGGRPALRRRRLRPPARRRRRPAASPTGSATAAAGNIGADGIAPHRRPRPAPDRLADQRARGPQPAAGDRRRRRRDDRGGAPARPGRVPRRRSSGP